eukprot:124404_1
MSARAAIAHPGTEPDQEAADDVSQRRHDADLGIRPQRRIDQRIAIDVRHVGLDTEEECRHEAELPLLAGFRDGLARGQDERGYDPGQTKDLTRKEEECCGGKADE